MKPVPRTQSKAVERVKMYNLLIQRIHAAMFTQLCSVWCIRYHLCISCSCCPLQAFVTPFFKIRQAAVIAAVYGKIAACTGFECICMLT